MLRASVVGAVVAVVAFVTLEGQALAGRGAGIIVPPVRVDVGASFPLLGGSATEPGRELLVGLHWATVAWKPTSIDFGIGYVGSTRSLVRGYRDTAARSTTPQPRLADELTLDGVYLALGRTLFDHNNIRTWVEVRGELLKGRIGSRTFSASGGAVRIAAELYKPNLAGAGGRNAIAIVAGTLSFGVYLEAAHRDLSYELGPTGISGGISVRLPFVLIGVS
jgi:hypothetical protein